MSIRGLNVTTYLQKKNKTNKNRKKELLLIFLNKHALQRMHPVIRISLVFFFLTTICELNPAPPPKINKEKQTVFALYNLTAMLAFLYV